MIRLATASRMIDCGLARLEKGAVGGTGYQLRTKGVCAGLTCGTSDCTHVYITQAVHIQHNQHLLHQLSDGCTAVPECRCGTGTKFMPAAGCCCSAWAANPSHQCDITTHLVWSVPASPACAGGTVKCI